MAIRNIVTVASNPSMLRRRAPRVTDFGPWLTRIATDMGETLDAKGGVGLAAPQIGESMRLILVRHGGRIVPLVNPEILKHEGETRQAEGCLSLPGFVALDVPRAARIKIRAQDLRGVRKDVWVQGEPARIVQHEVDHLNGVLITDLVPEKQVVREETLAPMEHANDNQRIVENNRRADDAEQNGHEEHGAGHVGTEIPQEERIG